MLKDCDPELETVLSFIGKIATSKDFKILDVGCGKGRLLRAFNPLGFKTLGVEVNPLLVEQNMSDGLAAISVADFQKNPPSEKFDLIITNPPFSLFREFLRLYY